MESFEPFAGYYFFNVLLMVLQALHIFWAGLILRMVYKFLGGKVRRGGRAEINYRDSLIYTYKPCNVAFYRKPISVTVGKNKTLNQDSDMVSQNIEKVSQKMTFSL